MREDGVEACLYLSARDPERGTNLAVFENVFRPPHPLEEERWTCTASRERVEFQSGNLLGSEDGFSFPRDAFLVAGELPAPAL
jgi:hypothetical protein